MNDLEFMMYYQSANGKEKELLEKFEKFQVFFGDMCFQNGYSTHDYISVQYKSLGNDEWYDSELDIPEDIQYSTNCAIFIKKLDNGTNGQYDIANKTITISPEFQDDDSVLLHEMIHFYEHSIEEHTMYYRDAIFICLYKDLSNKIQNLDDLILEHGHIYNQNNIAIYGGVHSILFLLKSFDIDIKMGYTLGTVFGYGNNFASTHISIS